MAWKKNNWKEEYFKTAFLNYRIFYYDNDKDGNDSL